MAEKILIVDDDRDLSQMVYAILGRQGFECMDVPNGLSALSAEKDFHPDLIVLDIMLPDINGIDVCRRLRRRTTVPIIMLTALDDEIDIVVGLEAGADDYIAKPFKPREMLARVRAQLRRTGEYAAAAAEGERMEFPGLVIDAGRHEILVNGEPVAFTPKEFELLHYLARRDGRVVERETLLEQIWGYNSSIDSRTLDVHIRRVRAKTQEDEPPKRIVTVPGIGYKFIGG